MGIDYRQQNKVTLLGWSRYELDAKEGQMMDLWVHNPYIIGCRNAEFIL